MKSVLVIRGHGSIQWRMFSDRSIRFKKERAMLKNQAMLSVMYQDLSRQLGTLNKRTSNERDTRSRENVSRFNMLPMMRYVMISLLPNPH